MLVIQQFVQTSSAKHVMLNKSEIRVVNFRQVTSSLLCDEFYVESKISVVNFHQVAPHRMMNLLNME